MRPREAAFLEELPEDAYLTDGRSLFRVVSRLYEHGGFEAVLEDCRTLDVSRYDVGELWDMRFKRVHARPKGERQAAWR